MLLACAISLPQAIARSSETSDPRGAAGGALALPAAGGAMASRAAGGAMTSPAAGGAMALPAAGGAMALPAGGGALASPAAGAAGASGAAAGAVNVAFTRGAATADLFHRVAAKASRVLARREAVRRALPPLVVRRVIAAGNRIADASYTYGGGHGNWDSGGYDCSGSVSYALHGGGLLDTALASGDFMSWGEAGPGRWITVYANGGHAFMVVAGRRFDTTGREESGSRWQAVMRDTSGYVVRHPRGL